MTDQELQQPEIQMPSPDQAGCAPEGGPPEFGVGGVAPRPNTGAAVDFLMRYRGSGPIVLTAIVPNNGGTESDTFRPEQDGQRLRHWIDARQGRSNIYFSVNPTLKPMAGRVKAKKIDIRGMTTLHVDLDPRAGEDLEQERVRAIRLLREFSPHPSFIIDSGGGFQAFWLLDEEQPVNGSDKRIAELEAYNQQVALSLHADACHDICRIMRLPGTLNVPDARKLRKGRKLALARLVEWPDDLAPYPLAAFKQAPLLRRAPEKPVARADRDFAETTPPGARVELDRLPAEVSDRCKAIIGAGDDPDDPSHFESRSEVLFYVCCQLARAGVGDEMIMAVITDRDFGISASVLDKPKPQEYAARQVQRARDEAQDDPVSIVNRRYFAVLEGRRVQYYREEDDGTLGVMNGEAFDFEWLPYALETPKGKFPYSRLWKGSDRRRYYRRGFILDPTEACDRHTYNLWKGFGVEPRPGEWPRLREHVTDILADGNADHADYILKWAAWSFQNPATPPRVALVFKGGEGVGKGAFCNALVQAFGVHGLRVQNMLHVAGRFNAHLRHLCMLFADEALVPGTDGEGTLKGLITEPTIPIEAKGVDTVSQRNHLHIVMASNNDWVVPASVGARRFAAFAVPDRRKGDASYFSALFDEVERRGGLAAMLHDLLALDLKGWHPEHARPDTDELARQKIASLNAIERTFFDCLTIGQLPEGEVVGGGSMLLPTKALTEEVRRATRRTDVTHNAVADLLGDRGFGFEKRSNQRPRGYVIPPLPAARARWDELFFPAVWDGVDEWEAKPERDDAIGNYEGPY